MVFLFFFSLLVLYCCRMAMVLVKVMCIELVFRLFGIWVSMCLVLISFVVFLIRFCLDNVKGKSFFNRKVVSNW